MKKLSDVVDKQVVKNTNFNTLKSKVNKLDLKLTDATTLIHKTQYNKRIWKKNFEDENFKNLKNSKQILNVSDYCCCS